MASDIVTIRVGGREYRGWKTARVTSGIEALSGSFDLGVSERWANQDKPWPIGEGDPCTVLVNGVPTVTGYIDARTASFDETSHDVAISGRDATGDLADSSVELTKWEFRRVDVVALVREICQPHGVSVSVQPGLVLEPATVPEKFSIDPGDTGANAIENLCRLVGVLPVSDGVGGLMLTRVGTARSDTALVEGKNIKSGEARFSMASRFAQYVVLGQHRGGDRLNGKSASAIRGTSSDPNVLRASRRLVVRPEGNVTAAQAKRRADWEASVRAARADAVSVVVQGWTQNSGEVWRKNTIAPITAPTLGVDGDALISQVTFTLSPDAGTLTQIELRSPDAFKPEPVADARSGSAGRTGRARYWKEIKDGV